MPYEFTMRRHVEFSETDMAGIVHFSNFFRYTEMAEVAFYRSLGLSVIDASSGIGWPRVHAECDYHLPLHFNDEFDVHLLVEEKRTRSIRFRFKFLKQEGGVSVVAARAKIVAVCVRRTPEGKLESVPIPEAFQTHLQSAPRDLLDGW